MKFSKLILDTNLFLVFIVGKIDIDLIPKVKRISGYDIEDFNSIMNFVNKAKEVLITNIIATEVCNHLDKYNKQYNNEIFKKFADVLKVLTDKTIKLKDNINNDAFIIFGFADAEIYNITDLDCLIMTDDSNLSDFLNNNGRQVLNINHLRQERWFN